MNNMLNNVRKASDSVRQLQNKFIIKYLFVNMSISVRQCQTVSNKFQAMSERCQKITEQIIL